MQLNELRPTEGARKKSKRLGRGKGSGLGKTSGKGHKGQNSRSGSSRGRGFEGGQMPLMRRLPKRGFNNANFTKRFTTINLDQLAEWPADLVVSEENLVQKGLIKSRHLPVKLLGRGDVKGKLNVQVAAVSSSAKEKVTAAGGEVQEKATA